MPNTTSIMIVCLEEDEVIEGIATKENISLNRTSDGAVCGGTQTSSITSYGAGYRSLPRAGILSLIESFKDAPFLFPELSVLIIDDDDSEELSGVHTTC